MFVHIWFKKSALKEVVARAEDHLIIDPELLIYVNPCSICTTLLGSQAIIEYPVLRGIVFISYTKNDINLWEWNNVIFFELITCTDSERVRCLWSWFHSHSCGRSWSLWHSVKMSYIKFNKYCLDENLQRLLWSGPIQEFENEFVVGVLSSVQVDSCSLYLNDHVRFPERYQKAIT